MGAPTVRDVLADILPYLGLYPDQEEVPEVAVPELLGLTAAEAGALLKEQSLTARVIGTAETVTDQVPAAGELIPGGSEILLYCGEESNVTALTVPEVLGLSPEEANGRLTEAGFYMKIIGATGTGTIAATGQTPAAGTEAPPGTVIEVEFSDLDARD